MIKSMKAIFGFVVLSISSSLFSAPQDLTVGRAFDLVVEACEKLDKDEREKVALDIFRLLKDADVNVEVKQADWGSFFDQLKEFAKTELDKIPGGRNRYIPMVIVNNDGKIVIGRLAMFGLGCVLKKLLKTNPNITVGEVFKRLLPIVDKLELLASQEQLKQLKGIAA